MEILYEKYLNIQKFIIKYRKYTTKDEFYDFATFKKAIQIEQYVSHNCIDAKRGRSVYIYMFKDQTKYTKTTPQFKRLVDKLPEEPADVIIISKDVLSIYINKALIKYNHLRIFNYQHKFFAIELAKGPLCSKHTILSNNEVQSLCARDLLIHPLSLPSISINDPQNIWMGGELGQIMKIESVSEITGKTVRYRIISPDSGKISNPQNINQMDDAHDNKAEDPDKVDDMDKAGDLEKLDSADGEPDSVSEYVDTIDDYDENEDTNDEAIGDNNEVADDV